MADMDTANAGPKTDRLIAGIAFVSAYVDDFQKGYDFYANLLGLTKQYDMGDQSCFFSLGDDTGLYLQGGNTPSRDAQDGAHSTFTFAVSSAHDLFNRLKEAGVETIENAPMQMGEGMYWFRFYDPAGNLIEALSNGEILKTEA